MNKLTHTQFAFIMKLDADAARRMMIHAYAKSKGQTVDPAHNGKKRSEYVQDYYPKEFDIDMLSKELNIPHLQLAVNEVRHNLMKRPTTRGHIMEYPQGVIDKAIEEHGLSTLETREKKISIHIRPVIKSLVTEEVAQDILTRWRERYKVYKFVVFE
jgi:hypothetical protein